MVTTDSGPDSSGFFSQYWATLKLLFLLRVSQPAKNIFDITLPFIFVIIFAVVYIASGGIGDPYPPVHFVGENAPLNSWSYESAFCIDPSFTGILPANLHPGLSTCTAPCTLPCYNGTSVGCRSVLIPGLCAATVTKSTLCSDSPRRPMPWLVPSFDALMLHQEIFASDMDVPYGLIAITADSHLFDDDGRPITQLRTLINILNQSHATFSPLLNESGPWREARAQHALLTPAGDAVGVGAVPDFLVFAKRNDGRQYARDAEGAVFALLHFEKVDVGSDANDALCDSQPQLRYQVRLNNSEGTITTSFTNDGPINLERVSAPCSYARSGFLTIQHAVESAFATAVARNRGRPDPVATGPLIGVGANMPMTERYDSMVMVIMGTMSGFLFLIAFLLHVQNVVSLFVTERESGTREAQLVMGARRGALYAAHATVLAISGVLTSILCAIGMVVGVFPTMPYFGVFVTFLGYAWSVSAFSFLISTFFAKSRSASTVAPLLYLALVLLYTILSGRSGSAGAALFWLMMMPFSEILVWFIPAAQRNVTVTVSQFFDSPYVLGRLAHLYALVLIYYGIAMYLDHVLPSSAAAPLHPLFFLMPSYWCPGKRTTTVHADGKGAASEPESEQGYGGIDPASNPSKRSGFVEPLPSALVQSVRVRLQALSKTFGSGQSALKAVDKLTLDMCEGQITILLGHNGAGKTTTVSMLTGLLPVTSGDATVYGNSLVNELTSVRRSLGLCPQKNVIWPAITVRDHLWYYATVKGVPRGARMAAVESLVVRLGLADKIDAKAGGMSGGQKRKLCVAIALIGGSKVVFLDEPTAGMDVQARLAMWEMLQEVKKDRTVIMSTHYMDEAEQLGDRVALMSHGKLHSCGTPLFLKQRLGVGYHLAVSMVEPARSTPLQTNDPAASGDARGKAAVMGISKEMAARAAAAAAEVDRRKKEVTALIGQYVPALEVISDVGCELSMRLPLAAVGAFAGLFDALDAAKPTLGVRSYAISPTTLEEVFLKVAADVAADESAEATAAATAHAVDVHGAKARPTADGERDDVSLAKGNPDAPASSQIRPMLMKRLHSARRDKKLICMTILMPLVFSLVCAALMQLGPPEKPPLTIVPNDDSTLLVARRASAGALGQYAYAYADDSIDAVVGTFATPISNSSQMSDELLDQYWAHGDTRYDVSILFDDTMVASTRSNLGMEGNTSVNRTIHPPVTFLINASSFHSTPLAVGFVTNALLNATLGGQLCAAATAVTNFPLPRSKAFEEAVNAVMQFFTSLLLVAPFLILPANYAAQTVKERETKAKHLQYISGASSWTFWVTSFAVDIVLFHCAVVVALASYLFFKAIGLNFAESYVYSWGAFFSVALSLSLYGFCVIPCVYVLGGLFDTHSSASNIMSTLGVVIGFLLNFGILILSNFVDWWEAIEIIFRVTPHYNLGNAMLRIAVGSAAPEEVELWDISNDYTIIKALIALVVAIPMWWLLLLLSELGCTARAWGAVKACFGRATSNGDVSALATPPDDEDDDVAAERQAIKDDQRPLDRLKVVDLVKVFSGPRGKRKVAVGGVTFGVHTDEVFAFLGTNGAGKTTTISILGGEFEPSYGHGYVDGYDVVSERDLARRNMGYCPQFDAVLDNLNTNEHLQLYGGLRGLTQADIDRDTETLVAILGLTPHRHKPASDLSGGNKRKLSIALALIGAPAVIFLDEPSAGLDPVARRALWDALGALTRGCSVVLTTHHLEEVEALAQRVGIMVDGRLVCMGPLSHLKNKFGKGYEVQLSCAGDGEVDTVATALLAQHPGSSVVATDGSRRTVEVPAAVATLGGLFRAVEGLKLQHPSLDFSVGQTSLEQVFVRVSKETEETAAAAAYGGASAQPKLVAGPGAAAVSRGAVGGPRPAAPMAVPTGLPVGQTPMHPSAGGAATGPFGGPLPPPLSPRPPPPHVGAGSFPPPQTSTPVPNGVYPHGSPVPQSLRVNGPASPTSTMYTHEEV